MAVNTWDGSTDTDWDTAANWTTTGVTDRVPTSADDVVIADVTNNPIIGGGLNPEIKSLTINSGGHLTAGANTITINSEDVSANYSFLNSGTFVSTSSTLTFTYAGQTRMTGGTFNNIIINHANHETVLRSAATVAGDLTITAGSFGTNAGNDYDLTVTGDVSVTGTLLGEDSAISFGSLTIASGGTYSATTGRTLITSEAASGYCIQTTGTFTHNKGLVEIDVGARITEGQNGPYWDLFLSDSATDFYTSETWEIYNNFDLVGDFDVQSASHHITVHGNMTIGDGSTTTRYMNATAHANNLTVGGTLNITNGATADLGTHGTVNVGGIRNTGGSIS